MLRLRLMLLTIAAATLLCLPSAFAESVPPAAQAPAAQQAAAPAAKPVARDLSRYKEETVPGGTLMLIAYMVMWGLVAGLVGRALLRQSKVEAELTELSERVDVLSHRDGGAA